MKRIAIPFTLLCAMVAAMLAGCASTTLRSAWFDTSYAGGPFQRILVVGVGGSISDRRVFEDMFAQKLTAVGVPGIPGYRFLPESARVNEPTWDEGIAKSGADGLLIVRVLRVDQKTRVSTMLMPGPLYGPYGGWWGPTWYAVPDVQQYETATVETDLWEVGTKRVVWSGTTETFNPTTVAKETPGFADLIIGQLAARGLLPAAK
jgi:hypothetical protein